MQSFIFDFNGTLFQDTPLHLSSWRSFFKRHGVDITDEMFHKYMCGPPDDEILRRFLGSDLSGAEIEVLVEEKEDIYRDMVRSDPDLQHLTPGADEMLDMLTSRGIPIAIATGSPKSNIEFYMNELHIARWFDYDHVFGANPSIPGKPDPAIYAMTMRRLGFDPAETTVVEDGADGIRSAAGAGVRSIIAIDTTMGPEALRNMPEVDAIVHDFYGFERFISAH